MPAKVTLQVKEGHLGQAQFVFDEQATCIIGRSPECQPQIPDDPDHQTISRYHCLLDINPPDICIRDFGSLNGTFVNGQKIGQRLKDQTADEAAEVLLPEYDLKDGDEIEIGKTVFRVGIYVPAVCTECSAEIPEAGRSRAEVMPDVYQCEACKRKAQVAKRKEPPKPKPKRCAKCGRNVAAEIGQNRHGVFICKACKGDIPAILRLLLQRAEAGREELIAIRGYEILKELGRGGMGAVYLARHEESGAKVALKVMLPDVAADDRAIGLFLREVENTKALNHSNVVKLHDYGCSEGVFFFTLEYCDAGGVDDLMKSQGGKLPISQALPIILQTLDGLEYAHNVSVNVLLRDGTTKPGRGLVHRDISPPNILLMKSGSSFVAKVSDFGLSKAFDKAGLSGKTVTGMVAGKPWFMPRQQVVGFKRSKPSVDVWAASATLYYMLTGAFPRDFPRGKDRWQTVLQTSAVPIRNRDASIPKPLADVIDRALIDRPEILFKSAAEFKRELEKAI